MEPIKEVGIKPKIDMEVSVCTCKQACLWHITLVKVITFVHMVKVVNAITTFVSCVCIGVCVCVCVCVCVNASMCGVCVCVYLWWSS